MVQIDAREAVRRIVLSRISPASVVPQALQVNALTGDTTSRSSALGGSCGLTQETSGPLLAPAFY
ncbi:hypothetical protein [Kribbella sp. NPDC023855]|uniref:hypothetical protein n=1 Tax=Kribbella sp. NPDC023855 TaxID=3154698 RepID=UPI0033C421DF